MTWIGIRATYTFNYLVEKVGRIKNFGFSKRDAFNYIKIRRAMFENGDTNNIQKR